MGVPSHGPDRGWYWEVVLVWLTRPMLIHSTPTSVTADQPRPVAEMKQLVQRSGKPSLPSHKTGHCWHWTWRYCQTTLSKLDCFSFQETSCCLHPAHQQADGIHSFIHPSNMQLSAYSVPGTVSGTWDPAVAAGDEVTTCVVLSLAPYLSQVKAWSQGLQGIYTALGTGQNNNNNKDNNKRRWYFFAQTKRQIPG